jgi:molybdenum cofactor biosynthesis protein B
MTARREHHERDAAGALEVAVLTVSDTRSAGDDASGDAIVTALEGVGHRVAGRAWVRDEIVQIQTTGLGLLDAADALVVTGGTGPGPRDVTPEAFAGLFEKELPGFGERFRDLSVDQVGELAVLSRACAGLVRRESGLRPVFLLPGSPRAVRLAMDALVLKVLPHVLGVSHVRHEH